MLRKSIEREEQERRDLDTALRFFESIDFSKLDEAKTNVGELLSDKFETGFPQVRERTYRVFHHSFKMYHMRDIAFSLVVEMLRPLGFRVEKDWDEETWMGHVVKEVEG
jgi:hypothetical protein